MNLDTPFSPNPFTQLNVVPFSAVAFEPDIAPGGEATFVALKNSLEELRSRAPEDCDVLVQFHDISVVDVVIKKPDALIFSGLDCDGHDAFIVAHFSQVAAKIVYRKKVGPERVVTGFWRERTQPDATANELTGPADSLTARSARFSVS
jgi:hypothetical protein